MNIEVSYIKKDQGFIPCLTIGNEIRTVPVLVDKEDMKNINSRLSTYNICFGNMYEQVLKEIITALV